MAEVNKNTLIQACVACDKLSRSQSVDIQQYHRHALQGFNISIDDNNPTVLSTKRDNVAISLYRGNYN